ncbi:hypothetical protein LX36DRAFT_650154 [Colletotrichum falcatum]|nr:hypothetical protein LX36DRAFT_650154 [Colletotrichum falcatum]
MRRTANLGNWLADRDRLCAIARASGTGQTLPSRIEKHRSNANYTKLIFGCQRAALRMSDHHHHLQDPGYKAAREPLSSNRFGFSLHPLPSLRLGSGRRYLHHQSHRRSLSTDTPRVNHPEFRRTGVSRETVNTMNRHPVIMNRARVQGTSFAHLHGNCCNTPAGLTGRSGPMTAGNRPIEAVVVAPQ